MISIVIPALNEETYIAPLIKQLLHEKEHIAELWVCDACSTDATKDIVLNLLQFEPKIKYLLNEDRYVSNAFNRVYELCEGKYMALLGAHALYPTNFLSNGLKFLERGEADVVGGPLIQKGRGDIGAAIAFAMSSKVGVGNTEFRTCTKKMYVDSVAFAIYRKDMLQHTGVLNTKLIRNQDDEFHYRIRSMGYKILMVPEMASSYYVRDNYHKLFKQYFGYGYYKPLVLKLVHQGIRIRHFIPGIFVAYILLLPLCFYVYGVLCFMPIGLYITLLLVVSFNRQPITILQRMIAIMTLHVAYGFGFLKGLRWLVSNDQ